MSIVSQASRSSGFGTKGMMGNLLKSSRNAKRPVFIDQPEEPDVQGGRSVKWQ